MASMIFFVVLVMSFLDISSQQQRWLHCSSASDLRKVQCVSFAPRYNDFQWATCVADEYAMRISNKSHSCRDGAHRCWYQCMLELYNVGIGIVVSDCRCSPDAEAPTDILPSNCYQYSSYIWGVDCSWYRQCLEVRYPCEGTEDGYSIEYAEKFCNLYTDNYNDFTRNGRKWIDGVRNCLQVSLIRFLRPWVTRSCADIRKEAFDSHPNCYTNPAPGVPGICELSCLDLVKIMSLVIIEGGALKEAPFETIEQMLSVAHVCNVSKIITGCVQLYLTTVIITINESISPLFYDTVSTNVMMRIADTLAWNENGFRWYWIQSSVYYDDDGSAQSRKKRQAIEHTLIKTLLVDAKPLNMPTPTNSRKSLAEAVEDLATATRDGLLSKISVNATGTQMVFEVLSVGQCADKTDVLCNSTNITEIPIMNGAESVLFTVHFHSNTIVAMFCLMLCHVLFSIVE